MRTIDPIFKSEKIQALFDKNGFVKIPLLNHEQSNKLTALFKETAKEHEIVSNLHHTTTDTQNLDLICRVDSDIKSILIPELDKILQNYKPLVATFHIKEFGLGSATGLHQDPTFVDESKYSSANVWVALQDIDEKNGNLFFISGSNHVVSSLRVTPSFPSYYEDFNDTLNEIATHVPLKKGEAVIFNNSTIHAATENLTNEIRLAATLLVCSSSADWMIYYHEENAPLNKIEQYYLDFETFISIPKNGRPDKKAFQKYISYQFPKISKKDFLYKTGNNKNRKINFFQKIKNILMLNEVK
jgi:hypothetical protein